MAPDRDLGPLILPQPDGVYVLLWQAGTYVKADFFENPEDAVLTYPSAKCCQPVPVMPPPVVAT